MSIRYDDVCNPTVPISSLLTLHNYQYCLAYGISIIELQLRSILLSLQQTSSLLNQKHRRIITPLSTTTISLISSISLNGDEKKRVVLLNAFVHFLIAFLNTCTSASPGYVSTNNWMILLASALISDIAISDSSHEIWSALSSFYRTHNNSVVVSYTATWIDLASQSHYRDAMHACR